MVGSERLLRGNIGYIIQLFIVVIYIQYKFPMMPHQISMEYRNDRSVTDGHDGEEIIEVRDLVVRFGDVTAVDGISFSVRRGEIFGFLGPNGAGKTTTIRTITTIQRMTSGSIRVDGFDVSDDYLEVRRRIGIAQQHISLDKHLTVRQNIKQHALLHKIPRSEMDSRIERAVELLGLDEYMDRLVDELSGGWKRKTSIVCSIVHEPEVLLLDEPTAGLDTKSRHVLWAFMSRPDVGSSRKSTFGSWSIAQTIAARFFHPPDRESTGLSRYSSRPKNSVSSAIFSSRSRLPIMWYMACAVMFSLMVRSLSREICCWMTPSLFLASIGFFERS